MGRDREELVTHPHGRFRFSACALLTRQQLGALLLDARTLGDLYLQRLIRGNQAGGALTDTPIELVVGLAQRCFRLAPLGYLLFQLQY